MSKRQIIGILMLSPFYFTMTVNQRREMLDSLLDCKIALLKLAGSRELRPISPCE